MKNNDFGIYVHIPFCMSKCSYCSFVSKCANELEIATYFEYLLKQIRQNSDKFKDRTITSIYIGGGTPSFADSKHIICVIDVIKDNYNVAQNCEISIECNPCSTTIQKLTDYKNAGINRISFGVQSLNNDCLQAIGRKHNAKQALNAIAMAKECGFKNISADLLIGIPNQTQKMLLKDITTLANAGVNHISAYMLMLEEGTRLYELVCINKALNVASSDECVNMYNCAYSLLKQLGYMRYEISNFAKPNFECKHNLNYWHCGEYIGFGLSAYSYYNNMRIDGLGTFEDYYFNIDTKNPPIQYEVLTPQQKIEEYIMLGLRTAEGINIDHLNQLGYDIMLNKKDILNLYANNNIINIKDNNIRVCEHMFGATNQIILELLP